ncbi:TPA: DUF655 domain-containing protein [Candidatus Bipolaricaulota bacterium]|nr:DUF655 domain-containing protein [Candidatus Bipolaricaulota bacterium]
MVIGERIERPKLFEEWAYVLDFLPRGRIEVPRPMFRARPIIQLIGENYFTLLEAVPKRRGVPSVGQRTYTGKDESKREIGHIIGRITYEDLSSSAKSELPSVVATIIKRQERRFVRFFNEATALTPKMHTLELLPGIGKKMMWGIIREREARPFVSFDDVSKRAGISNVVRVLAKRVIAELSGETKYKLFVR